MRMLCMYLTRLFVEMCGVVVDELDLCVLYSFLDIWISE
jgi:hypothetical protein